MGFSRCDTRAYLLHGMQDLPGPGTEPISPVLADGFFPLDHQGSPGFAFYFILPEMTKIVRGKAQRQMLLCLSFFPLPLKFPLPRAPPVSPALQISV